MQIPTALQTQKRFPLIISQNAFPQSVSRWTFLYIEMSKGHDKRPRCFCAPRTPTFCAIHSHSRELIVCIVLYCILYVNVLHTESISAIPACLSNIRFSTARLPFACASYNIRTLDATNWLVLGCCIWRVGVLGCLPESFAAVNSPQAQPKEYTNSPFELKIISCVEFQQD